MREADRAVFSVDKRQLRFAKFLGLGLAVAVVAIVFLYLYGFHVSGQPPASTQVTYVLDQDLVRFLKFAGGVLGIFVTVDLFIWGFDIKKAAAEVKGNRDETRDILFDVRQIRADVGKTKGELETDQKESARLLVAVQAAEENMRLIATDVATKQQEIAKLLAQSKKKYGAIVQLETQIQSRAAGPADLATAPTARRASYNVPEIARLYNFPPDLDGRGQTIGLIELGGGYRASDINKYFDDLKLPTPKVSPVSVDGTKKALADGLYGGGTMNIEVAGAVAPGAHIVVYLAANTEKGFYDAVMSAVNDKTNHPSILSISWGGPESNWSPAGRAQLESAFQEAAAVGITVVCAGGDSGATGGVAGGEAHVLYPASSPWVLACGGTRLEASNGKITSEVVWNDEGGSATGGGVSEVFARPDWQSGVNVPQRKDGRGGRGVPDVAALASPQSGYLVFVKGHKIVVGGTAIVAPLWAGLVALINQGVGQNLGYFNPLLYSTIGPKGALRDIVQGNNGNGGVKGYQASVGWDACAGWGSPNGQKILEVVRSNTQKA